MEPKGSLLYLQESTTCPYPEPDDYSPRVSMHVVKKLMAGAVYISACF
jgi:hypothetical protein